MPTRRVPTLADAKRQVWVREAIGLLLIGLGLIFLLLFLVKHMYQTPASPFFPWVADLHRAIDAFLLNWPVLAPLWWAIPPWHPITGVPSTAMWEYVYPLWGAIVEIGIGLRLRLSAHRRRVQITTFQDEMQREAWRQQARRAAGGVAPDDRGTTTVIGQATLYQYPAPPESWSQTTLGSVILGLIIALVGGIIVGLIVLYAEYSFFQVRWPSSRN
jgi:hypothetical protein